MTAALDRLPLHLLAPAGARARLSILIFHRVLPVPDPLFPDIVHAASFDRVCGWLATLFNVLPLDEAAARLAAGTLPARAASITFDDGYADNWTEAAPILARHRLPATFFVASGFLDGGRMWNDTVIESVRRTALARLDLSDLGVDGLGAFDLADLAQRRLAIDQTLRAIKHLPPQRRQALTDRIAERAHAALPDDLMLRSEQLRALHRAGFGVGAHTVSHPILATLDDAGARHEIAAGRQALQDIVGAPVTLFAYPNGKPGQDYTEASVRIVGELGFAAAVSTAWGAARAGSDHLQLPRFTPWDNARRRFALRMARNLAHP